MALTISPGELVAKAEDSNSPGLLARHHTWKRVPLADVADVLNGFAFKSHAFNYDGNGIPLIRIRDVGRGIIQTYYSEGYETKYLVNSGDMIVGMDGDFRVAVWRGPMSLLNQRVCKISIRNIEYYDTKFLMYVLQGYLDAIGEATSSVTVKHLSSRSVEQIPLPLPPLAEQHRIVEALEDHLSHLDLAVNNLRIAQCRSTSLMKSVIAKAMAGGLASCCDEDEPVHDLLKRVERDVLPAANGRRRKTIAPTTFSTYVRPPSHWSVQPLGALCHRIEYGTSAKAHTDPVDGDMPVLRMGNIQDGRLDMRNLKYLPGERSDITKLLLRDGDLLFNRTNSAELVGKSAVYRSIMGPATFASYLIRCQLADGVEPEWVNLCINSPQGRRYVASVAAQQVGQANVNGTKLAAFPIPLPPHGEQLRILAELHDWDETVARTAKVTHRSLQRSAHLRHSLLCRAFTGRLVPQDPADEPASVLLDRIRAEHAARGGKPKRTRRPRKPAPLPPTSATPIPTTAVQQELPL